LHFVQNQQLITMCREEESWLPERRAIRFALQVEHHGVRVPSGNSSGQGRLADLARAEQRDGGVLLHAPPDSALKVSIYHPCVLNMH